MSVPVAAPAVEETFQLPAASTSLAAPAELPAFQPTIPSVVLNSSGPLTPAQISSLIDELRNPDVTIRLNSFRRIPAIASMLGSKRTRDELIPYISEFCDDDDEVLMILSTTLGDLVEAVGGSEFAHVLLPPLETLAGTEEATVRNQSVASMQKIVGFLPDAAVELHLVPLLKKMASQEWFTSRISAAGLFYTVYTRVNEQSKKELRSLYLQLCRTDETPMVKRASTQHLGEFCSAMDSKTVYEEFFPVLQKLAKDDQDSVRLLTVSACVSMAKIFGKDQKALNVTKMTQIINGLIADPSWRVRYKVADQFCELSSALGASIAQSDSVLDDYVKLLADPEAEVRTAAASRVGDIARLAGDQQTIKKFFKPLGQGKQPGLSVLQQIVNDTDEATSFTRAALASAIMSICTILKPKDTVEYLLPLFLQMLKDKNSDVRLNLISKFESIPNIKDILPLDSINDQILASINGDELGLAKNTKWRVRLQVIELIPNLAKQLGSDFFDAKLSDMCMAWLGDSVWSIREAATANLTKLAEGFGIEWAKKNIIPKVINLGAHKSYLYRMTAVFAIRDMAKILGPQLTTEKLLPVVVKLASDSVPNVRFNSARVLGELMTNGSLILPQPLVEHTLASLKADTDADVKYYADQSLIEINNPSSSSTSK